MARKVWTTKEILKLTDLVKSGNSVEMVAKELRRSTNSVARKANKIGLSFVRLNEWTEEEKDMLINAYAIKMDLNELSKRIGRSLVAIKSKARHLGITYPKGEYMRIEFTKEEELEIVQKYIDMVRVEEISKTHDTTNAKVNELVLKYGIPRRREQGKFAMSIRRNTIPFKDLMNLYVDRCMSMEEIARMYGVSRTVVSNSLDYHGIDRVSKYKRVKSKVYGKGLGKIDRAQKDKTATS